MPEPKTIDVGVVKLLTQTGEETDERATKASKPEKKENNVLSSCKNDRNKTEHCDNFAYRRQQTQTFNPRKIIIPFVSGGVINPSEELSTYSVKVNAANNNGGDVDSISAAVVDLTIFARGSENLPIGDCTNSPTSAESFGVWEEHTKGVGGKLLLRMGFQPGKGLGKKLQGISDPIQVQQRWGRGALGLPVPPVPPPLLESPTLTKSDAAPLPVIHNFDIGHWDSKVVWNSKNSIFGSPVQQQPRKVPQRKIFQTKGFSRSKGSTQV